MIKDIFSKKYSFLFLIILLHISAWAFLKPVWPHSDDYSYLINAEKVFSKDFHLTYNQFQNRFGVYLPTALLFYFFEESAGIISLWPLIASLLTIIAVYLIVDKLVDRHVASIAAFLIATNIIQVTHSIALFPDLIVSFYSISAILLLYIGRNQTRSGLFYSGIIVLLLFIGFFTKETILLIFPFIGFIMVGDLFKKENIHFWKLFLFFGLIAIVLFFLTYFLITGDAFHRIKSLTHFVSGPIFNSENKRLIEDRYVQNLPGWINNEIGYLLLFVLAIPAFFQYFSKKQPAFIKYILLYTLFLLIEILILFHLPKYGLLFRLNRFWMMIIAPLSILSAFSIFSKKEFNYKIKIVLFAVLTIVNYLEFGYKRALLLALFLTGSYLGYTFRRRPLGIILMLLPFLLLLIYFIYQNSNYRIDKIKKIS